MMRARARSRLGANPRRTTATSSRSLFAAIVRYFSGLQLIVVINQGTRADQADICTKLRLNDLHSIARKLHRSLLDDSQGGLHQHWPHLGYAAAQDNHLRVKAMDDVDEADTDGLCRVLDDGPCHRYS